MNYWQKTVCWRGGDVPGVEECKWGLDFAGRRGGVM